MLRAIKKKKRMDTFRYKTHGLMMEFQKPSQWPLAYNSHGQRDADAKNALLSLNSLTHLSNDQPSKIDRDFGGCCFFHHLRRHYLSTSDALGGIPSILAIPGHPGRDCHSQIPDNYWIKWVVPTKSHVQCNILPIVWKMKSVLDHH